MSAGLALLLAAITLLVGAVLGYLLGQLQAARHREGRLHQLIEPLQSALAHTETQAQLLERERRDAYAGLRQQLELLAGGQLQLERETRNLVTALRRPEVRGRWGELTLRRVVEIAGLSEHCDFTEQPQLRGERGDSGERSGLRPDLIVHLPGARDLIVDAKTPLEAFLAALEAPSEELRRQHLARHAQQLRARIRELAAKGYGAQFARSPEFAILFLPGEQFLSSALAEDRELIDHALEQNVIIATPATLVALLKAVAFGWRQTRAADNAAQIRDIGRELHGRLATFIAHLEKVGQRLGGAVDAFNAATGSLERQVLPQARRFRELGATGDEPLASPAPLAQQPRRPAPPAADPDLQGPQ